MLASGSGKRFLLSLAGAMLAVAVHSSDAASPSQVSLLDLRGQRVDPLEATDTKATVFLFTRTDCPISNRYAPEVQRLYEKFGPRGVAFWLVYPDPDESVEAIRKHIKEYKYPFGVLRDPQQRLVKMTGVRVTPEAAVFVAGAHMVYRGRIDDRYVDFGKTRPAPTIRDLERVLEAILAGKSLSSETTPAVGCFIPDLK